MTQVLVQAVVNFAAVAGGLFVLWSLVGGMRELPVGTRAGFAVVAGVVSAVATFAISWIVGTSTAGVPLP